MDLRSHLVLTVEAGTTLKVLCSWLQCFMFVVAIYINTASHTIDEHIQKYCQNIVSHDRIGHVRVRMGNFPRPGPTSGTNIKTTVPTYTPTYTPTSLMRTTSLACFTSSDTHTHSRTGHSHWHDSFIVGDEVQNVTIQVTTHARTHSLAHSLTLSHTHTQGRRIDRWRQIVLGLVAFSPLSS